MNKNRLIDELNKAEYTHYAIISYIYATFLKMYNQNMEAIPIAEADNNADELATINAENKKLLEILSAIEVSEDYNKCFELIADWKSELETELNNC